MDRTTVASDSAAGGLSRTRQSVEEAEKRVEGRTRRGEEVLVEGRVLEGEGRTGPLPEEAIALWLAFFVITPWKNSGLFFKRSNMSLVHQVGSLFALGPSPGLCWKNGILGEN